MGWPIDSARSCCHPTSCRDELEPRVGEGADRFGEGRYSPEHVGAVYDELLRRADLLLRQGEDVVLDASWLDPERRSAARAIGIETSSAVSELRCTCPDDLATDRIRIRGEAGEDASEATVDVAQRLAAEISPWPEAVAIHTEHPLGQVIGMAEAVVTRPGVLAR